jgi:hypothetical protein
LTGDLSQEGVSAGFRSLVPIYADFGNDAIVSIGSVRLVGTTTQQIDVALPLPRVPKRIVINAFHDVLARD